MEGFSKADQEAAHLVRLVFLLNWSLRGYPTATESSRRAPFTALKRRRNSSSAWPLRSVARLHLSLRPCPCASCAELGFAATLPSASGCPKPLSEPPAMLRLETRPSQLLAHHGGTNPVSCNQRVNVVHDDSRRCFL